MNQLLKFFFHLLGLIIQEWMVGIFSLIFFWKKSKKDVRGQLALVTGGAQGLGKAIAFRLAQEGCNIAICDLNMNEAQKTSEEIKRLFKVECNVFKADVSDTTQVNNLYNEIEQKIGTVDILVNNAGILSAVGILEGEDSDIDRTLRINLTSHFWMVRKFLPSMIKQKRGHLVAISSAAGKGTLPFAASYCASKFGVVGLYSSIYDDLCIYDYDDFIKVTCACPGFINTRSDLEDILDETCKDIPRMQPEEAADEIVKAILLNKREIMFPVMYRLLALFNDILPPKAEKYLKIATSKLGTGTTAKRLTMTRK